MSMTISYGAVATAPALTIKYVAVVVAAAAGFILGWIWYTPLFGKAWIAARGYTPEQVVEGKKHAARNMAVVGISLLIMAWVLAAVSSYMGGLDTWIQGVKLGGLAWLGFLLTAGMIDAVMSTGRKIEAFYIDAGYWLVTLVVMGTVVCLVR
jgi:hypothetical protein